MQPYAPRTIHFRGLRQPRGWTLKFYTVTLDAEPLDEEAFEIALRKAEDALPEPDRGRGRYGLGFLIAHQGRTGDYVVLGWWDHENELPVRVWVRRRDSPWRPAESGESFCVWDMEVIWAERRAWIDTMLAEAGPDPAAWAEAVDDRFRSGPGG